MAGAGQLHAMPALVALFHQRSPPALRFTTLLVHSSQFAKPGGGGLFFFSVAKSRRWLRTGCPQHRPGGGASLHLRNRASTDAFAIRLPMSPPIPFRNAARPDTFSPWVISRLPSLIQASAAADFRIRSGGPARSPPASPTLGGHHFHSSPIPTRTSSSLPAAPFRPCRSPEVCRRRFFPSSQYRLPPQPDLARQSDAGLPPPRHAQARADARRLCQRRRCARLVPRPAPARRIADCPVPAAVSR